MAMALPATIVPILDRAARRHGLPAAFVRAVAWVESRGKPDARSPAGAMGVMQLMPMTAKALGVTDAFDPAQNIEAGVMFLARLVRKYEGDSSKALAAYNWGPGNVDRATTGWPSSVYAYVKRVADRADLEARTMGASAPTTGPLSYLYQRTPTHRHRGVDLVAPEGTLVHAADSGIVAAVVREWTPGFSGYGRVVVIEHPDGLFTMYAHLQRVFVEVGDAIHEREPIGTVGRTAFTRKEPHATFATSRAHLHFEVARTPYPMASEAPRIDPVWYLQQGHTHPLEPGNARAAGPELERERESNDEGAGTAAGPLAPSWQLGCYPAPHCCTCTCERENGGADDA